MHRIPRRAAIAATAGAILILASLPASAATSGLITSNRNVKVDGCEVSVIIGTQRVSAQELNTGSPCDGNVGVQSYYTPNGINYYYSTFAYDATLAIKSASISQGAVVSH